MRIEVNENFYNMGFFQSAMGFIPPVAVVGDNFGKKSKLSAYRIGQFFNLFQDVCLRTNSNILSHRKEFVKPCSFKELHSLTDIKERAFWNFFNELEQYSLVKNINGVIYVNPLWAVSPDMDYIREEIYEMFPDYATDFDKINMALIDGVRYGDLNESNNIYK